MNSVHSRLSLFPKESWDVRTWMPVDQLAGEALDIRVK